MEKEAAKALADRSILGILSYPAALLAAVSLVPGTTLSLRVVVPCGLLVLVLACARLMVSLSFKRLYASDSSNWRRNFRAGVYGSAVIWMAFALQQMSASGAAWPTWAMLLINFGLAAGASTSLSPDPPLFQRYVVFLLGSPIAWGLLRKERYGVVAAVMSVVYLAFILVQTRYNSRVFRQGSFDAHALREASRRREALVNSIDGIVWEANPRREFTFVSERAETILGYPVARWFADPSFWRDHIHPDDLDRAAAYSSREIAAGRDYTMEYRMLAPGGDAVWLRDIVSVGREGPDIGALRGVMVDVTAQKGAEEASRETEKRFRTLFEHAPAGMAKVSPAGSLLEANVALCQILGYSEQELLTKDWRELTHPEDLERSRQVRKQLRQG